MSFTFFPGLTRDVDLVRIEIADTNPDGYFLYDETIDAKLTSEGSVNSAVLACIRLIIAKLSQPGVKLDWLTVDNETARKAYRALLDDKKAEYGVARISASAVHTYRADSRQTSEPDYTDGA